MPKHRNDHISDAEVIRRLRKGGLDGYTQRVTRIASNAVSPNRIIVARIPRATNEAPPVNKWKAGFMGFFAKMKRWF